MSQGHFSEQLQRLLLAQLADLAAEVERQGMELGMLLGALTSLIGRHQEEAEQLAFARNRMAGEELGRLQEQFLADHATMVSFTEPLQVVRQFHDRLRQRLEHLRAVVETLPDLGPGDMLTAARELFPIKEERAVSVRLLGGEPEPPSGPAVEIFR